MDKAFHRYYVRKIMPRVQEIILAVIGIGIVILALNYMALITADIGVLGVENFWKRVALVILVIFFSSYIAITYGAYFNDEGPVEKKIKRVFSLFGLFLLDLTQVTFAASMFGVLYISDAADVLSRPVCQQLHMDSPCLALPVYGQEMIFAFGVLWHLTVAIWYIIAEGLMNRNVGAHFGFAVGFIILIQASLFVEWFRDWVAIAAFAVMILWVYLSQARHWLGRGFLNGTPDETGVDQS